MRNEKNKKKEKKEKKRGKKKEVRCVTLHLNVTFINSLKPLFFYTYIHTCIYIIYKYKSMK